VTVQPRETEWKYGEDVDLYGRQNADISFNHFKAFRKTMRPDMLWSPFVHRLTRELARFGDAYERGKRPKLAICTPPQVGKSTGAEDLIAWLAGRNPNRKCIYASYAEALGTRMALNLQRTFTSPTYRELFPHIRVGVPGWTANTDLTEFFRFRGSFRATTIGGPITGLELDLGVLDDYTKGRAEASSKVARDRTWHWFADDFLARFSKDSALLVIATRWHIDDLLGRLKKKWPSLHLLTFPAIAEKDDVDWRKKGEPLFPEHKPLDFLLERKRLMSEASWQAEYQQQPFFAGSGAIPIENLRIVPYFDLHEVAATVVAIDKAGVEGGDGAFTAICIMHRLKDGRFLIERIIRGHWGALERERHIKECADETRNRLERLSVWPVVVVEQEPGSGGLESVQATIRNLAGHNCVADKPGAGRSKEVRAEPFCNQVQASNVWLHAGSWIDDFLEEAGNWPASPIKDQVDACAMALSHLTSSSEGPPLWLYELVNA
jgi:predicted phage terminase large subunit-like protein